MVCPVRAFTAYSQPPQSGKYTVLPATVGVAETSLVLLVVRLGLVVKVHLGFKFETFAALSLSSFGWLWVSAMFCPAVRHCPAQKKSLRPQSRKAGAAIAAG